MSRRLLSYDQLREKGIRYSKTQIFRLIKAGKFPRPLAGAGRTNSWVESEIDAFIDNLMKARDSVTAA